jgi:hypothetical protein
MVYPISVFSYFSTYPNFNINILDEKLGIFKQFKEEILWTKVLKIKGKG